ncbi:MAG: hypothetical protein LBL64_10010 [Treponema sp.]|jgi:hypothetical protein|nr:hypothetical protein [Treponema sp.]
MAIDVMSDFVLASTAVDYQIKKALLPLGIYAHTVSASLGGGGLNISTRPICLEDKNEREFLEKQGLIG